LIARESFGVEKEILELLFLKFKRCRYHAEKLILAQKIITKNYLLKISTSPIKKRFQLQLLT